MQVNVPRLILPLIEKYRDSTGKRIFNFYKYYSNEKIFNKAINYGLKEIGALLGIDDLEYYAARHSWATIALNKVGIDKYTVHAALNHVDESMRVTDIYIERDFVNENKANDKVVKYVFGKSADPSSSKMALTKCVRECMARNAEPPYSKKLIGKSPIRFFSMENEATYLILVLGLRLFIVYNHIRNWRMWFLILISFFIAIVIAAFFKYTL